MAEEKWSVAEAFALFASADQKTNPNRAQAANFTHPSQHRHP